MAPSKYLTIVCAGALCVFLLSGCAVRSYVAPIAAPPSPYFHLTAVPTASQAIDQTVRHMNEVANQQAAEAAAAQAAEEAEAQAAAEAEAAAAEAAAKAEAAAAEAEAAAVASTEPAPTAQPQASYGYADSYDSGSVVGQTEDVCVDPVLNF